MTAQNPASGPGPEQYLFITPVWGKQYVERFVKLSLPTMLSEGNLGAIPPEKVKFLIYTRREDARAIMRSPAYRRLKSMVPVSVRSLDDLPDPRIYSCPHELQTAAYMRGIKAGEGKQTAFVFLTPDILIGDGTFRSMVRLTDAGKRVILVAGIRMTSGGAMGCVAQHRLQRQVVSPIPCRSLTRYCLDNLHPISVGHIINGEENYAAQHLYWKVADHGLLVRGFHLHPLVVWPSQPEATIRNTLDDEYITRACPDRADWHTVTDSDEMCVIEFSDPGHKRAMVARMPLTEAQVLEFMIAGTSTDHRELVRRRICFHTRDINTAEWSPVIARSDQLVARYLNLYERGNRSLPLDAPLQGPAAGSILHGRLDTMFGRQPALKNSALSVPRLMMLGITTPFWALYRILNFKMYRYLDRLYAEILDLRNVVAHTRQHLNATTRQLEQLRFDTAHLIQLEDEHDTFDSSDATDDEPVAPKIRRIRKAM